MRRYQSFGDIVNDATDLCLVWRDVQGKPVTVIDLMDALDSNADLVPPKSYMLSEEGAIGVTDAYEYAIGWILFPMEDSEEKEACLQKMRAHFKEEETQQAESSYKFCENCGQKLNAGAKFCTKCGKPQD